MSQRESVRNRISKFLFKETKVLVLKSCSDPNLATAGIIFWRESAIFLYFSAQNRMKFSVREKLRCRFFSFSADFVCTLMWRIFGTFGLFTIWFLKYCGIDIIMFN